MKTVGFYGKTPPGSLTADALRPTQKPVGVLSALGVVALALLLVKIAGVK